MMTIYSYITSLIEQAKKIELIDPRDEIYVRNQIMHILKLEYFPENITQIDHDTIPNIIEKIVDYAVKENIIEDLFDIKEILAANIMNTFLPKPSEVEKVFKQKYAESPEKATDYFYRLSQHSNYIQTNRIKKNIHFKTETKYGELDITINLSKPEKSPEEIKRERELQLDHVNYPKCALCRENEGYAGRIGHAARSNHRIISIPFEDETWYFQYSPYVYYNEHSILLSREHREMKINRKAFERLLCFIDKFPHYFIGSNADLPIVGGSILSHDHYQAGRYEFAMTKAEALYQVSFHKHPNIEAEILKWPLSVIRLRSEDISSLVDAADDIFTIWKTYSDPDANIIAATNNTRHNTVTPIARKRGQTFELDLVLRNNRTTEQYPLGIFHPHEDVQHIKKENIGLIEVMGLAVLPARLKDELEDIKHMLMNKPANIASYHKPWAKQLQNKYGTGNTRERANKIIETELGQKFMRVLEDAGVYKQTEKGIQAFQKFIDYVNS